MDRIKWTTLKGVGHREYLEAVMVAKRKPEQAAVRSKYIYIYMYIYIYVCIYTCIYIYT